MSLVSMIANDAARPTAPELLDLLDSPAEEAFDRLTRMATRLLGAPTSFFSLADTERLFIKSGIGTPEPWTSQRETPLSNSFCQYVIGSGRELAVSDARLDTTMRDNPVVRESRMLAYAGVPVRAECGQVIGAFCVSDSVPHEWSADDLATLRDLADLTTLVIRQRCQASALGEGWETADIARREKEAMLDRISDAFYALDRSWRFVYMNAKGARMLQRSADELIGANIWDEFPETVDSPLYATYHHAIESGEPATREFYYPPLDTWFEGSAYPGHDGLSVYFRDITERRRQQDSLRALREVVDASTDAIIGFDCSGIITSWNPAAEQLFRYAPVDMIGQPVNLLVPLVGQNGIEPVRDAVSSGQTVRDIELQLTPVDGNVMSVAVSVAPVFDSVGERVGYSTIVRDITDRVRAEEDKARLADMLQAVFVASPMAVMVTDVEGVVTMWNPTAERLFGWASDDVIGKRVPIVPATDPGEVERRVASMLRGEQTFGYETLRQHKDGSLIDVSISSSPIRDGSGAIVGTMAMFLDMREQKLADARLHETQQTLRSIVEQTPGILYRAKPETLHVATYISPQLESLTGWTVKEIIDAGTDWFSFGINPDDAERVRSIFDDASRTGEPFKVEYRLRHKDGHDIWVQDDASLILDGAGNPLCWQGLIVDISHRKTLEAELRHQAFHDALTGLPNRALLRDRTNQLMASSRRGATPAAILFLDLDNFKVVNDSLGHEHGDAVLVEVAQRLMTTLREADTISRFGGDEFAVLLNHLDNINDAIAVAERVRSVLEPPIYHVGHQINLTTSIGVALTDHSVVDADDLLRRADVAMYRAKTQGRNEIAVFDAILHAVALRRLETESDLRRAIAEQQFELHYQPKIEIASGEVIGFEALVRWNHPTRGLVPPGEFIPLAEESGLIVPLGQWILDAACRQAVEWGLGTFDPPMTVNVNLSPRQFQQANLVEMIEGTLRLTGLNPACLTVELTETAVMADAEVATQRLQELKRLGVGIAIDDFGTGYSSLAYLKRFPVDTLKIDRSFVSGLGITPEDTAIVTATIALAHTLGITVVAEGVETCEQRDLLLELGCERAQGYYFSRPLPADAASELILLRDDHAA